MFKKREKASMEGMDKYLRSKYKLLKNVKGGTCVANNHCHIQAVNDRLKNNTDVIMVLYAIKDKSCCFNGGWSIHFLNYDKHKKSYIDNTIGDFAKCTDYLFVRKVEKDENIRNLLEEYNKKMKSTRMFFFKRYKKIKRIL